MFQSAVGRKNYEDAVNAAVDNLQGYLDGSIAKAVRDYIETQTSASSELEAKSKLVGQWIAMGIYLVAAKLSQGGNKVHLMYWDERALMALIVAGGKLTCDNIEDRITEVKGLLDYMVK